MTAWGSDLHFGHEYHAKIDRMALAGNRTRGKYLASLRSSFYALVTRETAPSLLVRRAPVRTGSRRTLRQIDAAANTASP